MIVDHISFNNSLNLFLIPIFILDSDPTMDVNVFIELTSFMD